MCNGYKNEHLACQCYLTNNLFCFIVYIRGVAKGEGAKRAIAPTTYFWLHHWYT